MVKKIFRGILWVWGVLYIVSCNMEIPESVNIKGKPGIHIPLGYLADIAGENTDITSQFDDGNIGLAGSDAPDGPKMYSYEKPGSDLRRYLVHYPIADMDLDLSEYVQALDAGAGLDTDALGNIPGTGTDIPIPIPFGDLGEWITQVRGANFKITLTVTGSPIIPGSPNTVTVKFSHGNTSEQPYNFSGNTKTHTFESGSFIFYPATDTIMIQVNAPAGTLFKPELTFDWSEADIETEVPDLDGESELPDIGNISDFLGDGITLKGVRGYIYMSGLDDTKDNRLSLKVGSTALVPDNTPIMSKEVPVFSESSSVFSGNLEKDYPQSIMEDKPAKKSQEFIDLTSLFAGKNDGSPTKLHYQIVIGDGMTIKKTDTTKRIAASMAIELPLEFTVTGVPDNLAYKRTHVKLDLQDMMPLPNGDGKDLFGRTGKTDDPLSMIDIQYVKLMITDCRNTLIGSVDPSREGQKGGITLGVMSGDALNPNSDWSGLDIVHGMSSAAKVGANNPFIPSFEFLIPIDSFYSPEDKQKRYAEKNKTLVPGTETELARLFDLERAQNPSLLEAELWKIVYRKYMENQIREQTNAEMAVAPILRDLEFGTGTLQILRPQGGAKPEFDFFLTIEAQTELDKEITF